MAEAQYPQWKVILAFVLDFLSVFFVFGYGLASATGGLTKQGLKLEGWSALLLIALIIAYFLIGSRTGGRLWQRILGVRPG
jgi:hypothetical protein